MYSCPVRIHHGPGHQSTTYCQVSEPHEIHKASFGSYGETASWVGGDIFSDYFDEGFDYEDKDNLPTYVSDASWYQKDYENYSKKYMPKDYRDPRLEAG